MKIIKRNGTEVAFDISKIVMAISKANIEVDEKVRLTPVQIDRIAESVEVACEEMGRSPSVEEIQDLVEKAIMSHGAFEVAKEYITYRYTRNLLRQSNTTDDRILSLIECNNEEVKQETLPAGSCCPGTLWRHTRPASSTSTIPITMPSICTTAI